MSQVLLRDLITRHVHLDHASGTGFYPVLCKICNDHGKKGKRAGFKFEGDVTAYHCFNCNATAVYDPKEHSTMPTSMEKVLEAFQVPESEWKQLILNNLSFDKQPAQRTKIIENIEPPEIPLPPTFYPLQNTPDTDKWATIAKLYLKQRGINYLDYPFMMSKVTDDIRLKKWARRIIIPIYKDGKLIFYIGRDLTDKAIKKYESPPVTRKNVLYGFDKLFTNTDLPLYVVEGWFDAYMIDGVAILGNELSDGCIAWLNRSPRPKVYIPDRFGNGFIGAEQAIDLGWSISAPDPGISGYKDISEAVNKYGKMYVIKTIADYTRSGESARILSRLYCK